jgi:hypothetical protein
MRPSPGNDQARATLNVSVGPPVHALRQKPGAFAAFVWAMRFLWLWLMEHHYNFL